MASQVHKTPPVDTQLLKECPCGGACLDAFPHTFFSDILWSVLGHRFHNLGVNMSNIWTYWEHFSRDFAATWERQNKWFAYTKHSFVFCEGSVGVDQLLGPQRYTPPPGLGLENIGKWLVWTTWWCIWKLLYNQMVHTSHFPIFSRPKPGGGVYLRVPQTLQFVQDVF